MGREEVYREIEGMFGLVPSFFNTIPDDSLELEWQLFKRVQFETGPIPNKYRELIGVAIAAATKCRYCIAYHTEIAKLNGATEAEIEDAVHFAKSAMGWSTYLNGMQVDYEQFRQELAQACAHVRSHAEVQRAA
jgi:AhpD family alkylhydroperoxidase